MLAPGNSSLVVSPSGYKGYVLDPLTYVGVSCAPAGTIAVPAIMDFRLEGTQVSGSMVSPTGGLIVNGDGGEGTSTWSFTPGS